MKPIKMKKILGSIIVALPFLLVFGWLGIFQPDVLTITLGSFAVSFGFMMMVYIGLELIRDSD